MPTTRNTTTPATTSRAKKDAAGHEPPWKLLTNQYKAAAKDSCRGTIAMAEALVRADQELKGRDLAAFYEGTGVDPESSKVRKFRCIGEAAARLNPYLDRLPSAWTTLYRLTQLEADEFDKLMDSGAVHPLATWGELAEALGHNREDKEDVLRVHLDLSALPDDRLQDFVARLTKLCTKFGVSYEPAKAWKAKFDSLNADAVPNGTDDNQGASSAAL